MSVFGSDLFFSFAPVKIPDSFTPTRRRLRFLLSSNFCLLLPNFHLFPKQICDLHLQVFSDNLLLLANKIVYLKQVEADAFERHLFASPLRHKVTSQVLLDGACGAISHVSHRFYEVPGVGYLQHPEAALNGEN